MREYSKFPTSFWINKIGRKIKKHSIECRFISFYLLTCPSSNMLGMYYLPLSTISSETGISLVKVKRSMKHLKEINFCDYDYDMEHVWVKDMARHQIGILKENDKRIKYCNKEYNQLEELIFSEEFFEVYFNSLGLIEKKRNRVEDKIEKIKEFKINENKSINSSLKKPKSAKSIKSVSHEKEQHEVNIKEPQDMASPLEAPPKQIEREIEIDILEENKENIKRKVDPEKNDDAEDIFNHWKKVMKKRSDVSLDTQRQRVIVRAIMKFGYTPKLLRDAIDGCSLSAFHMGKNEQNVKYDQLSTIFKSPEQIDKFLEIYEENRKIGFVDVPSPVVRNNIKVMNEWLEEQDEDILLDDDDNARNFNR